MWPETFSGSASSAAYPVPIEISAGTLVVDALVDAAPPRKTSTPRPAVDRAKLKAARKRGRKGRGK